MPHNENWPKRLRVRNDPGPKRPTKIGRNDPRPNLGRNDPGRNDPAETTQGRNVPDSVWTVFTVFPVPKCQYNSTCFVDN